MRRRGRTLEAPSALMRRAYGPHGASSPPKPAPVPARHPPKGLRRLSNTTVRGFAIPKPSLPEPVLFGATGIPPTGLQLHGAWADNYGSSRQRGPSRQKGYGL